MNEVIGGPRAAAARLNRAGLSVTLDYVGEAIEHEADTIAAADTYLRVIDRIREAELNANISLKLTQMGQDIDGEFLRWNTTRILDRARDADLFVRFDMESSAYALRTIDFFVELWEEGYRNVGIVLQSCLRSVVDQNFVELMAMLLSDGFYPGIATHDEAMIEAARRHAAAYRIPPRRSSFRCCTASVAICSGSSGGAGTTFASM